MKSNHRCCLFTPGADAKEAHDNWEAVSVENYGECCGENLLYAWDEGGRRLVQCKKCGGYVLVQKSEFHGFTDSDDYYTDFFAVSGPEQARWLNEHYNGFEIEEAFRALGIRYLMETNGQWGWSCEENHLPLEEQEALLKADAFAKLHHAGLKTKSGEPYITHPRKVASFVEPLKEKIVALLHDTVEDTDVTIEDIRTGFGDDIAECVDRLTKTDDETYEEYIKELVNSGNMTAIHVKLADLTHNSDLSRFKEKASDPANKARAEKYKYWKAYILEHI